MDNVPIAPDNCDPIASAEEVLKSNVPVRLGPTRETRVSLEWRVWMVKFLVSAVLSTMKKGFQENSTARRSCSPG